MSDICFHRPDGVWDSVHVIAATTRPVSVSFRSRDSQRRTASGCLPRSMVELVADLWRVAWSSRSQISRLEPVSRPKVSCLSFNFHWVISWSDSSIAISRRIATDTGGKRGPVSSRTQQDRFRRPERENPPGPGGQGDRDAANVNNVGVPPAVPGFGFSFPGMPMFPPGFMMGGAQAGSQPPPPGQGS